MPEVEIDKKTRWECQRCGGCCRGIIISANKNLFICRLYPFVIELDNIVENGVARPEKAFLLGNLKIHSECLGYGKGKRIFRNKNLQRKLEKMGHDLAIRFKECFERGGDVSGVI